MAEVGAGSARRGQDFACRLKRAAFSSLAIRGVRKVRMKGRKGRKGMNGTGTRTRTRMRGLVGMTGMTGMTGTEMIDGEESARDNPQGHVRGMCGAQ